MVLASTLENRLSPAIAVSFALHVLIFVMTLLWSWIGPAHLQIKPSVYKVSIVSLSPNQKPATSNALPKTTVEQLINAKPETPPSAPQGVKMIEKAPLPKITEKSKKDMNPLPAEKKVKEKDLQNEVARIKNEIKMKEAIAALGSTSAPENPQSQISKPSEGTAVAGLAQDEAVGIGEGFEQAQYQEIVRAQVMSAWNLPQSAVLSLPKDIYVMVAVFIAEDGSLIRMEFQKSSNIAFFDQSVTRAIRRSSPLPRPPQSLSDEARDKGIVMRFSPQKVSP